ncbi:GGDEF domain-containing protein [Telmatobacter sp. DSM 110680]|uniref:diguanylate cyclase n=1 Tax=Telmatobacter sp. DSM 110680 TaxID=3036704 RepID=A0AAU7DHA9_9BACT
MRDSFGSRVAEPAAILPAFAAVPRVRTLRVPRTLFLTLATIAAALVCVTHAVVAGSNTVPAAGFGYLCLSLIMLGCASAFWTRARSSEGTLYIRWSFISAAALSAAIGYLPSCTQGFLNTTPARQFQTACFNSSEALYMLAAVLFFSGVTRSIVILDILQALMFSVLRFNLVYSPVTRDHFSANHLLIGQLMALFLFVVAIVACLGAASRAELMFLRTLSCFLALRLISFFLANQVSYVWLRYEHCSFGDVPGEALLVGFALYLLYTRHTAEKEASQIASLRSPSVLVRSLMPSFLTVVNLILGVIVLRISVPLATATISLSLVGYMARTVLLQAQAVHEKAFLESRNQQLEGLATRDPLTGIGNRRSLASVYRHLQAADGCENLSFLLMDIDYFKQANDRHGHLHGDKVLVALAKKLESLASSVPGSHCARFGGDEFALLLLNVSPQKALILAEELRALFSAHAFEAETRKTSLSIGIASLQSAHDLPLESLICSADEALYRAKSMGRNRVEVQPVCEPEFAADHSTASALRIKLQHATR